MNLSILILQLLSGLLLAEANTDWQFSYENKGYDFQYAIPPTGWKGINRCGQPNNQSPINVFRPLGLTGLVYGESIPAELEQFEISYQDPKPGSQMSFERKNFFMFVNKLPDGSPPSYIKSVFARDVYGFNYTTYYPTSFHVHYKTEHAFEGKYHDISMHTNHYTESPGSKFGDDMEMFTLSFSFSVDHYDRSVSGEEMAIIDTFFGDLNLLNRTTAEGADDGLFGVNQLRFREFMEQFDYANRWMYLGGAAFPPCNQINFWQVLHTVYPIKKQHMLIIKRTFELKKDELGAPSNNRGIFPINGHKVRFVADAAIFVGLATGVAGAAAIATLLI